MKKVVFIICILFSIHVEAQMDSTQMSADDLYSLAREKAFNGQREEARRLCQLALAKSPNYHEIALLMGRTYAWDGKRDEARRVYKEILNMEPQHIEATLALADVELWDDKPAEALIVLNKCLIAYPQNTDLLLKKSKALINSGKDGEAVVILGVLLDKDPGCVACIDLERSIKTSRFKHTLSVNGAADIFSSYFDPMYYSAVQFGTATKMGSLVGRINYSNRFQQSGIQPEVDFYPGLWKGAYGYLNYGFTTSSLFSRHRVGAEIFQSLPHSLETSAGFRYMDFGKGSTVTIYTASLGWYYKNYWFNARTFITPGNGSFSRSLNITARRYFKDANNYIGITGGAGFSPDARRIQTNTGLDAGNNIYLLKSQKIECTWQQSIRYNMNIMFDVYYSHQELSFSYGEYVNILGFTTGIKIRL
jgi:YaiO family outer membrane protein